MSMNELASWSVGTVSILAEFYARLSLVFHWKSFLVSKFLLAMRETALNNLIGTQLAKGHSTCMR
jgi:hypothetical protein